MIFQDLTPNLLMKLILKLVNGKVIGRYYTKMVNLSVFSPLRGRANENLIMKYIGSYRRILRSRVRTPAKRVGGIGVKAKQ